MALLQGKVYHLLQPQERERSAPLWNSGMTSQERCSPWTTRRSWLKTLSTMDRARMHSSWRKQVGGPQKADRWCCLTLTRRKRFPTPTRIFQSLAGSEGTRILCWKCLRGAKFPTSSKFSIKGSSWTGPQPNCSWVLSLMRVFVKFKIPTISQVAFSLVQRFCCRLRPRNLW